MSASNCVSRPEHVGTALEMKLEDYRIEKTAVEDAYPIEQLVRAVKRDMLILFPVTFLLIIASEMTSDHHILTASYVSFALIFLTFIARLLHFRFKHHISDCPVCGRKMTRETRQKTTYIVCHRCRIIFSAYRPSADPDRIYDEVNRADSWKEQKKSVKQASEITARKLAEPQG